MTLFNRLIGDDRSVVHDMPGTTRDAIDTVVETDDGPIRFVDTAGMRRKSRIDDGTEYYSLVRALRAVDDADIALLVIDATEGVTARTSAWPSGSTPPAARSSCCSTSGSCSTTPSGGADVTGQIGPTPALHRRRAGAARSAR